MPTEMKTKGNPYCVHDDWYFTDEKGKAHGPYYSLGRATIAFGRYIRDHIEQDAPKPFIWFAMLGVLAFAGWVLTHH